MVTPIGWLLAAFAGITVLCLLAAWRMASVAGRGLRTRLLWASAAVALLNLAAAALWIGNEWTTGPSVLVLTIGVPYVAALAITGKS